MGNIAGTTACMASLSRWQSPIIKRILYIVVSSAFDMFADTVAG
jgi:hypothetical protein